MTSASPSPVRVLLLSDRSPLSLGVEALLRDRMLLEVLCDPDADRVQERIQAFHPDVVVLGMACREEQPTSEWLHVLEDQPGIRLVSLSLQDNSVRIFDRGQMQTIPDAAKLLDAFPALGA
jgi:hypothetical protein